MNQGAFFLIADRSRVDQILAGVATTLKALPSDAYPQSLKLGEYDNPRSLTQNALLHVWFRDIAKSFTDRGNAAKEGFIKEMLKHKFLGTTDISTERLKIPPQINKLPKHKGELHHFMNQVEEWAADHGVRLTNPADSEYMKMREAQR